MNEETLNNLSREEAIYYLDNEMDYTYQLQQENKELHNKIDKAIEYIEKHSFFVDDTGYNKIIGYPKETYNAQEVLGILKDSDVDEYE